MSIGVGFLGLAYTLVTSSCILWRFDLRAIFISYRREDTQGEAGRLFDELAMAFGERNVFMDVDAIQPGRDFRKAIEESVQQCSVLLCMIGQEWATCSGAAGVSRLADTNDFVRVEIAHALRRDIPVIPVLVRGAQMPQAEQLPEDLRELVFRNAVEVGHARWKSDAQVLIRALRALVGDGPLVMPAPAVVAAPVATPAGIEWAEAELERVVKELAVYVGPIAEILVKRAAKKCGSVGELCGVVALEIEGAGDRARFLGKCGA